MELTADIDAATLAALIGLVRKHTGMAMTEKKSVLLQGRLRPRLRALSLNSYRDYVDIVETDKEEVQLFVNMVKTNDTVFFRTPHVWKFIFRRFLHEWHRHHPGETLRTWSAAAATGEEAYSIAIPCEEFRRQVPGLHYQLLATDISTEALATAEDGMYRARSVDRIKASHPRLVEKYFEPRPDGMRITTAIKNCIRFKELNLLGPLRAKQPFDIVFLRNVLIYLDAENQERILNLLRGAMKGDAKLVLGKSESMSRVKTVHRYEMPLVYSIDAMAA